MIGYQLFTSFVFFGEPLRAWAATRAAPTRARVGLCGVLVRVQSPRTARQGSHKSCPYARPFYPSRNAIILAFFLVFPTPQAFYNFMYPLFFAALLALAPFLLFAQGTAGESAYFIQVASYANPKYSDFKKIHNLGYLFEQPAPNGTPRIMLGTFSSQSTATQVLAKVKAQGYKDAFVHKVDIDEADGVYVVQLATFKFTEEIHWADWQNLASPLYGQMSDEKIRLHAGLYKTEDEAEKALRRLQSRGSKDMFIKRVSAKALHKVSAFEMGRSASSRSTANTGGARSSIKALQQFLQQENIYRSNIDGAWGKATEAATSQYRQVNSRYENYQLLSQRISPPQIEEYSLQYYLNLIGDKPQVAEEALRQFKHPLAKVYRAYMYLHGDVKIPDYANTVNTLMNEACEQVFGNYRLSTRSDFRMDYSYRTIGQLLMHLRELHEAVVDEPQVPCWLFRRHPDASAEAFAPHWGNERDEFAISTDCGSFLLLPELKLLIAVSRDFSEQPDKALAATDFNALQRLYVLPTRLNGEEGKRLEQWYTDFWVNLKGQETGTPLQKNTYKMLYFSFHEALIQTEEHFLRQGFISLDARPLALSVLYTSINQYFGK